MSTDHANHNSRPDRFVSRRSSTAHLAWRRLGSAGIAALLPLAVCAQDVASNAIEEVTVTGSRIARADAESVGPLTTLTAEDITFAAALSVGELLQELPGAGVSLNSNGTQGTSFGVSSINLRYLGSAEGSGNRVLVLVDGHRWVNAAGGRTFRDFVDLNTIPMGLVDSIEVLKDGASAIYGADAIAGVVNIRTRRSIEGIEARLNYGQTSRSDGESLSADLSMGHSFGRVSALLSTSYVNTDPVLTMDRSLTAVAAVAPTNPPSSPRGLYLLPGVATRAVTRIPDTNGDDPADFRVATLPDDYYNTQAQGVYATGPSERFGVFGRIGVEFSDSLSGHIELLYNERKSNQLFSPLLLDLRGSYSITIPADHPYNPWQTAFTTNSLRLQRMPVEVGNRNNVQDVETQRIAFGLDGEFELAGLWNWDLFASHAKNDATFNAYNQADQDKIALALGPNDRCAANNCVPLNIFGVMTPQMADYIRYTARNDNGTEQTDVAFNISGSLVDLPAGRVGVAAGVEWREESAYDDPDAYVNSAPEFITNETRTTSSTREPTRGKYDLWEAYAELAVPLLADLPGARALDLSAAVRHSDYSSFGNATTSKLGLAWRPVDDLLIRGTFSEGFRAPSILELYQGQRQTTFQAVDPCNGGGAGLPGCAGVPATYNQNQFGSGTLRGTIGGNPDLKPETADTYSVGFAYTPGWAAGMSLTADWYRIEIDEAIASQSAQQLLTLCAQRAGAYCNLVDRDLSTGEVRDLRQAVLNFSSIEVEGLDVTWRYGFDTPIGRLNAVLDASRLFHFTNFVPQTDGTVQRTELAGTGDTPRSTYPKWKGSAGLRWEQGPWSGGYKARYIGSSTDVAGNTLNGGRTDDVVYHDLQLGHHFERFNSNITLGIDNVLDEMPPISRANNPMNFDIYTYDVRGRYYFIRLMTRM